MELLKWIGKQIVHLTLLVLLAFAVFKTGQGAIWLYEGAKKGHELSEQLDEVYSTNGIVLQTFLGYIGDVETRMAQMNSAFVQDIMNTRAMLGDVANQNQQISNVVNNDLGNLANVVKELEKTTKEIKEEIKRPSYDSLRDMTVLIFNPDDMGGDMGSLGTGVVVKIDKDYTYILTNNHVCSALNQRDCKIIENEKEYLAEPHKYTSTKYDMSLIKVRGRIEGKKAIKGIASAKPSDRAFMVGHHLGRPFIYGEGVFAGYDKEDEVVQIPTLFGNSGSGVFNQDEELIGLVYSLKGADMFTKDVAHGQLVPGHILRMFLGDLIK